MIEALRQEAVRLRRLQELYPLDMPASPWLYTATVLEEAAAPLMDAENARMAPMGQKPWGDQ